MTKIEKLKDFTGWNINVNGQKKDTMDLAVLIGFGNKINELVEAVNKLMESHERKDK